MDRNKTPDEKQSTDRPELKILPEGSSYKLVASANSSKVKL